MTNHTRGPQKGRVPPHIQDRVQEKREKRARRLAMGPWYRRRWAVATFAAILALIAGVVLGRFTAPDPVAAAVDEAEQAIAIADQAEVIWQGGTAQGAPPVSAAVSELRSAGNTDIVSRNLDLWIASYDRLIGQLETLGVPPAGDGVRRLALAAAQLSKDAVETLGAAATAEGRAQELLLDEVERLRARAEQYDASARSLLALLRGEDPADVPAPAATMPTLPRPGAPAAESPPATGDPSPEVSPTADATADTSPSPEPSPAAS